MSLSEPLSQKAVMISIGACSIHAGCGITLSQFINFIVRPSKSESCDNIHQCSICADCGITLSQFINNVWTSDNRCNDTKLIFSAGIYGLDSELVVENVSTVTVSGLEFIRRFDDNYYVISVQN